MRHDAKLSDQVRGIGARDRLRRAGFAVGYLALGALGVLGLVYVVAGQVEGGFIAWFHALLVVIGVGGLAMVGIEAWFVRHRPGARLGVAPSGAPATVVPRSPSHLVLSVVLTSTLVLFFGAASLVLVAEGSGWVAVTAPLAALLVWPLVPAARGRVRAGGLYLTAAGLEHRRDAVLWSVPWEAIGLAVPGVSVAVPLQGGVRARTTTTTPVVWNREVKARPGVVGIDCRMLGLDGVLVAAAINQAAAFPEQRAELGTPASLAWGMFQRS